MNAASSEHIHTTVAPIFSGVPILRDGIASLGAVTGTLHHVRVDNDWADGRWLHGPQSAR